MGFEVRPFISLYLLHFMLNVFSSE